MSFSSDLLTILSSYSEGYSFMRARMGGSRQSGSKSLEFERFHASQEVMRVTLSRLKKKGYVENKSGAWFVTKAGRAYIAAKNLFPAHRKKVAINKVKNMIISFDIPEEYKKKREWLRIELLRMDFVMLHKSVWFGPAPLPEKFIGSLHKLQLLGFIKFFNAKEADIV